MDFSYFIKCWKNSFKGVDTKVPQLGWAFQILKVEGPPKGTVRKDPCEAVLQLTVAGWRQWPFNASRLLGLQEKLLFALSWGTEEENWKTGVYLQRSQIAVNAFCYFWWIHGRWPWWSVVIVFLFTSVVAADIPSFLGEPQAQVLENLCCPLIFLLSASGITWFINKASCIPRKKVLPHPFVSYGI